MWASVGRALRTRRTPRGTAELSVVVVVASLLAGLLFGSGLSRTSIDLADGLTWLADDPSGDVIQINPATGRPEYRIDVGEQGEDLEVTQYDGRMFVINHSTGELTSFDLTSILFSGRRGVAANGASAVLQDGGHVFLVDFSQGSIAGIDPVTTDALGDLWLSPEGLADATIDRQGNVWAVDPHGLITQLRWSPTAQSFIEEDTRQVDNSGANSVLVGHDVGATLFGPDAGIVVQVGTGNDVVADAPELSGTLVAPNYAPAGLAPVSSPDTGSVIIVGGDEVRQVNVRAIGCERPDRPEVFENIVYVPCPGDDRVVRLAPDGSRAAPDIPTPEGGSPELVLDDGNLVINVPGSRDGLLVEGDGSVHDITRYDPDVHATPVHGVDNPPDPPTADEVTELVDHDNGSDPEPDETDGAPIGTPITPCTPGRPGCEPGASGGGNPPPDDDNPGGGSGTHEHLDAPTSVNASALPDGSVQVSWQHSGPSADEFVVAEVGGPTLATVNGRNRQAVVSVSPGPGHQFTVTARRSGDPDKTSAPSSALATSGRPGAPSGIGGSAMGSTSNDTVVVNISWGDAPSNGSPITSYTVSVTDGLGSRTLNSTSPSASYTTSCGDGLPFCNPGTITATVTAHNANGDGPSATGAVSFDGPVASPLPGAGAAIVTSESSYADIEGTGSATLQLSPPGDWASFNGTCSYVHTGNTGGADSGSVACGANNLNLAIDHGIRRGTGTVQINHSITFTAQNRNGSVQSATFAWTIAQDALCPRCQIP
jgi:hypothetical protein